MTEIPFVEDPDARVTLVLPDDLLLRELRPETVETLNMDATRARFGESLQQLLFDKFQTTVSTVRWVAADHPNAKGADDALPLSLHVEGRDDYLVRDIEGKFPDLLDQAFREPLWWGVPKE